MISTFWKIVSLLILCFVNLINYMDRFTIAGVLKKVMDYYQLNHQQSGLLQTAFVISYMLFAPLFGYLGDRYSRKYLMSIGVFFWSLTTFLGSFVPAEWPVLFYLMRALVGIGEASYSTIAPTIIADLFIKDKRSKALGLFYFAIPVGSGMGYIVGSALESWFSDWRWSLRFTPILGLISVLLILVLMSEPPRGHADGASHEIENSDLMTDFKYLATVRSYIWSTIGFTCVCYATGALSWFAPLYMSIANKVNNDKTPEEVVSQVFGVITCIAGILGVILGVYLAQRYRKFDLRADPLVSALGVFLAVPFSYLAFITAHSVPVLPWICIFFAVTLLSFNWSLIADILLSVIVPKRRSFAQSIQILCSHLFGDAFSPYLVGFISDSLKTRETYISEYAALQNALFSCCFILLFGAVAFLYSARFLVEDQKKAKSGQKGFHRLDDDSDSGLNKSVSSSIIKNESLQSFPPADTQIEPDNDRMID